MYGYVYLTTNLVNGKRYIGKRAKPYFDSEYKGSGKLLKRAFAKYGWDNFNCEIVCRCFSREELESEEVFLIDFFNLHDKSIGYNIARGGSGGNTRAGMSSEAYDDWIANLSKANRGKISHYQTAESRAKISEAMKGNRHLEGCFPSDETRRKISEASKGRRHSEEARRKIAESKLGKKLPGRKYNITCRECNEKFESNAPRTRFCPSCK